MKFKTVLIPTADSIPEVYAKFTKGKQYDAIAVSSVEPLYEVRDDNGKLWVVNAAKSYFIGGNRFESEVSYENSAGFATRGYVKDLLKYPQQTSESMFGGIASTESPLFFVDMKAHERDKDQDLEAIAERVLNMFGRDESRGAARGFKIGAEKSAHFKEGVKSASDAVADLGMLSRSVIVGSAKEASLADRVKELESELNAANNTIDKIREAMRTPEGEDAQTHAKVLRQMADALVSLWRDGK